MAFHVSQQSGYFELRNDGEFGRRDRLSYVPLPGNFGNEAMPNGGVVYILATLVRSASRLTGRGPPSEKYTYVLYVLYYNTVQYIRAAVKKRFSRMSPVFGFDQKHVSSLSNFKKTRFRGKGLHDDDVIFQYLQYVDSTVRFVARKIQNLRRKMFESTEAFTFSQNNIISHK
jgi:hypothetical protein